METANGRSPPTNLNANAMSLRRRKTALFGQIVELFIEYKLKNRNHENSNNRKRKRQAGIKQMPSAQLTVLLK